MASLKPIEIDNLRGGMNTSEATTIADNECADLLNMFYDLDGILTTRRGSLAFGEDIVAPTTIIHDCEATTNWTIAVDSANLTTAPGLDGNAVSFDIDVSVSISNSASLSNGTLGALDLSASAVGGWEFQLFIPTGFKTNLTTLTARLGSSAANDHRWLIDITSLVENSWNLITLPFNAYSSISGSGLTLSNTNFFGLLPAYTAAYLDQIGILVDQIRAYAPAPSIHSLQAHKKSDGTRFLLAGAGSSIMQYDESDGSWDVIKAGLTSGARFSSVMYKDIMYITNGVDDFMGYDGSTVVVDYPTVPKGKYLVVANDVAYLAGMTSDPSLVYYTNANPTNLQAFPNYEPINEDDGQAITGLSTVGPLLVVFKERSNYIFDSVTPAVTNTDYDGGCKAGRTIARVENDALFLSENGIFSLSQREGTSGALRGTAKSDNIRSRLSGLTNRDLACAIYWPKTSNYYFAVDDENSGNNRTIYLLSQVTGGWTYWKGINANEFCIWEDEDGVEHLLAANPYGGQVIEMETGFTDQGNIINWRITSKKYDFGSASRLVIYERADFGGFHSEQSVADATVAVTNVSEVTKTKEISYDATKDGTGVSVISTLGSHTLGSTPLGGGSSADAGLTMYPFQRYMPLYFTGRHAALQLEGEVLNSAFALSKISLWPIQIAKDTVPQGLYI